MKTKLLSLIASTFLLLSCTNDDEINPEILTQNQWQHVSEYVDAGKTYEVVSSIDFAPDGKVYSEGILRDAETQVTIGFHEYYTGDYQIINNLIKVTIDEFFTSKGGEDRFQDKNDLSLIDDVELTKDFQLRNKNTELHTIMPPLASSLGIIYSRVE